MCSHVDGRCGIKCAQIGYMAKLDKHEGGYPEISMLESIHNTGRFKI